MYTLKRYDIVTERWIYLNSFRTYSAAYDERARLKRFYIIAEIFCD